MSVKVRVICCGLSVAIRYEPPNLRCETLPGSPRQTPAPLKVNTTTANAAGWEWTF